MPLYDDDDRLDIRPYVPIMRPVPIPSADISDEPIYCLAGNAEWLHRLVGALHVLEQPDAWAGTDSERFRAIQNVKELLARIRPCAAGGDAMQIFGPFAEWHYMVPNNTPGFALPASGAYIWRLDGSEPSGGPGTWQLFHQSEEIGISGSGLSPGVYRIHARVTCSSDEPKTFHLRLHGLSTIDYPPSGRIAGEPVRAEAGHTIDVELNAVFEIHDTRSPFLWLAYSGGFATLGTDAIMGHGYPWATVQLWRLSEITGAQGPPGPRGEPGPAGPAGAPGAPGDLSNLVIEWDRTYDPYPRGVLRYGERDSQLVEITYPEWTPGPYLQLRVQGSDPDTPIEAGWAGFEGAGDLWSSTGLRLSDIAQPPPPFELRVSPINPNELQARYDGTDQWFHVLNLSTLPRKEFYLRVLDTAQSEIQATYDPPDGTRFWWDTELRACQVVQACSVLTDEQPAPGAPDTWTCRFAYRAAELYKNTFDAVLDRIEGIAGEFSQAAAAWSVIHMVAGGGATSGLFFALVGALADAVGGGVTDWRNLYDQDFWDEFAERLYCDMFETLQTESYDLNRVKDLRRDFMQEKYPQQLYRAFPDIVLSTIGGDKLMEWNNISTLEPPPGACLSCPGDDPAYDGTFRIDLTQGSQPEGVYAFGNWIPGEGLQTFKVSNYRAISIRTIAKSTLPDTDAYLVRAVIRIKRQGNILDYSGAPGVTSKTGYTALVWGETLLEFPQNWLAHEYTEYTYDFPEPIPLPPAGTEIQVPILETFATSEEAAITGSIVTWIDLYYQGSVIWERPA